MVITLQYKNEGDHREPGNAQAVIALMPHIMFAYNNLSFYSFASLCPVINITTQYTIIYFKCLFVKYHLFVFSIYHWKLSVLSILYILIYSIYHFLDACCC